MHVLRIDPNAGPPRVGHQPFHDREALVTVNDNNINGIGMVREMSTVRCAPNRLIPRLARYAATNPDRFPQTVAQSLSRRHNVWL